SRLISLAVRGGIKVEEVIEQLQNTHACPAYQFARGRGKRLAPGKSCASAIAKKLKELSADHDHTRPTKMVVGNTLRCKFCGKEMLSTEGCHVCVSCGFSKC